MAVPGGPDRDGCLGDMDRDTVNIAVGMALVQLWGGMIVSMFSDIPVAEGIAAVVAVGALLIPAHAAYCNRP